MIANLPEPLGLPRSHDHRPCHPALHRAVHRLHVATTWHGISRLIRDPLWKAGTASLLSVPLLAGIYQAAGGNPVVVEPSRFPAYSAALFGAGLAAAMATAVYRLFCPAVLKEQLRAADYAGYRPHVVDALRSDVVRAFDELMVQVTLGPEHAKDDRMLGRVREAELIEGLCAQGHTPVRYGYGCREMYAVQELAMRVGAAAKVPVRARFGREDAYRAITPALWMLPARGTDLYHLEVELGGPTEDGTDTEGIFLQWSLGEVDTPRDSPFAPFRERRRSAMTGVEHLVTPATVAAVREGIADWLTFARPNARAAIIGLLAVAAWQIAVVVGSQLWLLRGILL